MTLDEKAVLWSMRTKDRDGAEIVDALLAQIDALECALVDVYKGRPNVHVCDGRLWVVDGEGIEVVSVVIDDDEEDV